jgi:hypothetical protein
MRRQAVGLRKQPIDFVDIRHRYGISRGNGGDLGRASPRPIGLAVKRPLQVHNHQDTLFFKFSSPDFPVNGQNAVRKPYKSRGRRAGGVPPSPRRGRHGGARAPRPTRSHLPGGAHRTARPASPAGAAPAAPSRTPAGRVSRIGASPPADRQIADYIGRWMEQALFHLATPTRSQRRKMSYHSVTSRRWRSLASANEWG